MCVCSHEITSRSLVCDQIQYHLVSAEKSDPYDLPGHKNILSLVLKCLSPIIR
jgi:hypothetical protein